MCVLRLRRFLLCTATRAVMHEDGFSRLSLSPFRALTLFRRPIKLRTREPVALSAVFLFLLLLCCVRPEAAQRTLRSAPRVHTLFFLCTMLTVLEIRWSTQLCPVCCRPIPCCEATVDTRRSTMRRLSHRRARHVSPTLPTRTFADGLTAAPIMPITTRYYSLTVAQPLRRPGV